MTTTPATIAAGLADAVVARDFDRARGLLHPQIDFRAMTPNRIWEAEAPADIEQILRGWLADPDEQIDGVEATEGSVVEDTVRVGWRVRGRDEGGPFVYEQQAYVRERDGQIGWLRIACSGTRHTT